MSDLNQVPEIVVNTTNEEKTSSEETTLKVPTKTNNVPTSEIDIALLGDMVHKKMEIKNYWLEYMTIAEFKTHLDLFRQLLSDAANTNASRSPVNKQLSNLDKTIDQEIEHVKNYINEKFGKRDAPAYFAQFGIVKDRIYKLPKDREARKQSFPILLSAIDSHGFADKTYGTEFWTKIIDEYTSLTSSGTDAVTSYTQHVGNKSVEKKIVRKVINSVIFLIKAHYPDTWKNELRAWGFLKERY
jgi:hypothetical protein